MHRVPFLLIISDSDRKLFNVIGTMLDDTEWTERVAKCQRQGRNVNCHTTSENYSRDQLIEQYERQTGFKFIDNSVIDDA